MTLATLSYPYKPKASSLVLACVFFGACALIMGGQAASNDEGLILNGVIHFSIYGATVFYWCVAGVSGAFVAIALLKLVAALRSSGQLILTPMDITARVPASARAASSASRPPGR